MEWTDSDFGVRVLMTILFVIIIWLMCGCALQMSILPDLAPERSVSTERVSIPATPNPQFSGSAVVALDRSLYPLQGEIFQALHTGCGITQVEVVDEQRWLSSSTTPAHDYRVKVLTSSSSWQDGIIAVSVSATLSQNMQANPQRPEYRFVKNGNGRAYYGGWHDSYGRPRHTGVWRSREEALRGAMQNAMLDLCGYALPGVRIGASVEPQANPLACLPPTCSESQQTISLSGT